MHNLVQDMQLFFWFCILTNLDIIMGCLCWKTLQRLQNLMSMGRNSNQRTRIKLDKVAIDKQKKARVKDYPSLDKASKSTKTN